MNFNALQSNALQSKMFEVKTLKVKAAALFVFVTLLASFAVAQNQPAGAQPSGAGEKEPLYFVKIAATVAGNAEGGSMAGRFAIFIDQKTWASGLNDSDLGPFVKLKEAKTDRSLVCLFSQEKDRAACVYFDAGKPVGIVSAKADGGKIDPDKLAAAYKDISKDMLKDRKDDPLAFGENEMNADDGVSLAAFVVSKAAK